MLKKVNVSKEISDALVYIKVEFTILYDFMLAYENADWQEVCRQLIVKDINVNTVYEAYTETMCWYKDMFF